MVVVNGIAVSPLTFALGERRKDEHANRAIAELPTVFGLIPDDEYGATFLVFIGLENERHILLEPCVGA